MSTKFEFWVTCDRLRWTLFNFIRGEVGKVLIGASPHSEAVDLYFDRAIFQPLEEKWRRWKQGQEKSGGWGKRELWGFEGIYSESLFYLCGLKEEIKSKIGPPDVTFVEILPLWPSPHLYLPYYYEHTGKLEKAEMPAIDADFVILQSRPWFGIFYRPVFVDVKRSEPRFSAQERQKLRSIACSLYGCTLEIAWAKTTLPHQLNDWELQEVCPNCGALMARVGENFPSRCPWCKHEIVRWFSMEEK